MAGKQKAQYAPPASQVDLEERLENGNKSFRELSTSDTYTPPGGEEDEGRDFRVEDNDTEGYLAVSPEYQTYANETEAPLQGDEDSAEAQVFDNFVTALENKPPEQPVDPDDDEEEEVEQPDASPSTGGAAGSTGTDADGTKS